MLRWQAVPQVHSDVYGIMFYLTLKILHILGEKLHLSDKLYVINAAVYSV
jgi:hypothetical protein